MYTINFKAHINVDGRKIEKEFTKIVTLKAKRNFPSKFSEACTAYLTATQLRSQLVRDNDSRVVSDNAGSNFSFELGNGFNSKQVLFLPVKDPSEIQFGIKNSIKEVVFKQPIWCYQLGQFKSLPKRIDPKNLKTLVQNTDFKGVEKIYINCYTEASGDYRYCYNYEDVKKIIQGADQKSIFEIAVYVHDYNLRKKKLTLGGKKNISFNYLSKTPGNVHQFITKFFTEGDFKGKLKVLLRETGEDKPLYSFKIDLGDGNAILVEIHKPRTIIVKQLEEDQEKHEINLGVVMNNCDYEDILYLIKNSPGGDGNCELIMVSDFDCTITSYHLFGILHGDQVPNNYKNMLQEYKTQDEDSKKLVKQIDEERKSRTDIHNNPGHTAVETDLLQTATDFCLAVMGGKKRAKDVVGWIQSFEGNFCISSKGHALDIYNFLKGLEAALTGGNICDKIKYIHGNGSIIELDSKGAIAKIIELNIDKMNFIINFRNIALEKKKTIRIGYIDDDTIFYDYLNYNMWGKKYYCVECFHGLQKQSTGITEKLMKQTQEWYKKYKPRQLVTR